MRVLIFGLSGSGKTTLSKELAYHFLIPHYNADTIRELCNDWDVSEPARYRSAHRMSKFEFGILDFICPLEELRELINPTFSIWMDTIDKCEYDDTNKMFEKPNNFNIRIKNWEEVNNIIIRMKDFSPGIKGIKSFLLDIEKGT